MEQKLTAAIAAMYWGCGIVCTYMNNQLFKRVYKFSEDGICDLIGDGDVIYRSRVISECKLILKPLNEITDDDAVEVAKMDFAMGTPKDFEPIKVHKFPGHAEIDFRWHSSIGNNADGWSYSGLGFSFNATKLKPNQIDYLRSRGYDCGYGSIPSLISAGIAITKQNTQNEN